MNKYECYEYKVEIWVDEKYPVIISKYIYTILTDHTNYDSDEWYFTENEAHEAAKTQINRMMDGPDEPDYDAPTFMEIYKKSWEEDQKLKRR